MSPVIPACCEFAYRQFMAATPNDPIWSWEVVLSAGRKKISSPILTRVSEMPHLQEAITANHSPPLASMPLAVAKVKQDFGGKNSSHLYGRMKLW